MLFHRKHVHEPESDTNLPANEIGNFPRWSSLQDCRRNLSRLTGFSEPSSMSCPPTEPAARLSRTNLRASSAGSALPARGTGVRCAAAGQARKTCMSEKRSSKSSNCCGGQNCRLCCGQGCGAHCVVMRPTVCTMPKPELMRCCPNKVCPPAIDVGPTINDRCFLERELHSREMQLMYQREQMLLEQKLHHREQLLWDHEQFRTQQLLLRDRQFRYKVRQVSHEQDLHNRDLQIRGDREEILWARDMHQQDAITARTRQQLLLQRNYMHSQDDEASKIRLKIYNKCCNKPLTCGEDLDFMLPRFAKQPKSDEKPPKPPKPPKKPRVQCVVGVGESAEIVHIDGTHHALEYTPVVQVIDNCVVERTRSGEHMEDYPTLTKPENIPKQSKTQRRSKHAESPPRSPKRSLLSGDTDSPRQSRSEGKSKGQTDDDRKTLSRSRSTEMTDKSEAFSYKTHSPKPAKAEISVLDEHRKGNSTSVNQSSRAPYKRRGPIYIEPITITSNPTSCDCECHMDVTYSTSDICTFCDCDTLEIRKNRRKAAVEDSPNGDTSTTNEISQDTTLPSTDTTGTATDTDGQEHKAGTKGFSGVLLMPPKPAEEKKNEPECQTSCSGGQSPSTIPYGVESAQSPACSDQQPDRCAGAGRYQQRGCRRHRDGRHQHGCCSTRIPRDLICCVNGNVSHPGVKHHRRRKEAHAKRTHSAVALAGHNRHRASGERTTRVKGGSRNGKRSECLNVIFHNKDYTTSEAHASVDKNSEHCNKSRNKLKSRKRLSKQ